jgi:queuosine precursor transporter
MLFITIDLASVSVAYKMVSLNYLFQIVSGATFIFPLTYCLGDVVAEVYGYRMARNLIWLSLVLQFIFALLVTIAIHLPNPDFWENNPAYIIVFGSILRFVIAGTFANVASNFINIYIVSKLKIPFEGRFFWARSVLSTIISGFVLVAIIILVGFSGEKIDLYKSWIMFKSTFSLEILYAFMLIIPATMLAKFLKKTEKVDVYDYDTNFNPFNIR